MDLPLSGLSSQKISILLSVIFSLVLEASGTKTTLFNALEQLLQEKRE